MLGSFKTQNITRRKDMNNSEAFPKAENPKPTISLD